MKAQISSGLTDPDCEKTGSREVPKISYENSKEFGTN